MNRPCTNSCPRLSKEGSVPPIGKYTVAEVEERTGVPSATLRQWERRYGVPKPQRSESGYRYFGDGDLELVGEMKRLIGEGIPASRAAEIVRRGSGQNAGPRPLEALHRDLLDALLNLDGSEADRVVGEAHSLHPTESVILDLYPAIMLDLGRMWHDGQITTTIEHFASAYVQGRLHQLLAMAGHNRIGPRALVACAPYDQHELGALTLAVMLRREGFSVTYLGPNTPIRDLVALAHQLRPAALLVSASASESLSQLMLEREQFRGAAPVIGFGGHAFDQDPSRAAAIGGSYLGHDIRDAVHRLSQLVRAQDQGELST
jgi:DNA-binding transcriptional MerR regulator/methylmalonyl-CoA mutase cobalamin-binding subunit